MRSKVRKMSKAKRMAFREKTFDRQPNCIWCNTKMILRPKHGNRGAIHCMATIEHIVPLSQGGTHHESNLRLAHKRCNVARGSSCPGKAALRKAISLIYDQRETAMPVVVNP